MTGDPEITCHLRWLEVVHASSGQVVGDLGDGVVYGEMADTLTGEVVYGVDDGGGGGALGCFACAHGGFGGTVDYGDFDLGGLGVVFSGLLAFNGMS